MAPLTPVQLRVLSFVKSRISETGVSPTYDEICRGLGMSSRGYVANVMRRLEQRGAIVRMRGRARAVRVVDTSTSGRDRVVDAARALLDGITTEEIDQIGTATLSVRAELLGDLDIALAEME